MKSKKSKPKYRMLETEVWGCLWRSKNHLDGITEHIIFDDCIPVLFTTRKKAIEYINEKYGYIRYRKDLQEEPYGWKVPIPVKLIVSLKPNKKRGES